MSFEPFGRTGDSHLKVVIPGVSLRRGYSRFPPLRREVYWAICLPGSLGERYTGLYALLIHPGYVPPVYTSRVRTTRVHHPTMMPTLCMTVLTRVLKKRGLPGGEEGLLPLRINLSPARK